MPVRRSASFLSCSAEGSACLTGESNTMKSLPAPCIFVKSMRILPRIAESSQCGTIPEHTAIHYREYARTHGLLSSVLIDDAVLQPKCRQAQSDAVLDDCRNMLRPAKNFDYVNPLARLQ